MVSGRGFQASGRLKRERSKSADEDLFKFEGTAILEDEPTQSFRLRGFLTKYDPREESSSRSHTPSFPRYAIDASPMSSRTSSRNSRRQSPHLTNSRPRSIRRTTTVTSGDIKARKDKKTPQPAELPTTPQTRARSTLKRTIPTLRPTDEPRSERSETHSRTPSDATLPGLRRRLVFEPETTSEPTPDQQVPSPGPSSVRPPPRKRLIFEHDEDVEPEAEVALERLDEAVAERRIGGRRQRNRGKIRATPRSKSDRANLYFPVGRVKRLLKSGRYATRVSDEAAVYLAAVAEYLTAEMLYSCGESAKKAKKKVIQPQHVRDALVEDLEMSQLEQRVIIPVIGPQKDKSRRNG